MYYVFVVLVAFVHIFAKAFQQLNIVHGHKELVPPTTMLMAYCEVGLYGFIGYQAADENITALIFTGLAMTAGASAGAILSMETHGRLRSWLSKRRREKS